jgi:hypothetical protein
MKFGQKNERYCSTIFSTLNKLLLDRGNFFLYTNNTTDNSSLIGLEPAIRAAWLNSLTPMVPVGLVVPQPTTNADDNSARMRVWNRIAYSCLFTISYYS